MNLYDDWRTDGTLHFLPFWNDALEARFQLKESQRDQFHTVSDRQRRSMYADRHVGFSAAVEHDGDQGE